MLFRSRNSHIRLLHTRHSDREPLELASTELSDLALENDVKVEGGQDILDVVALVLTVEHLVDGLLALDRAGDVVDVLRLDERLEVVLEHFGEVVLELGTSEVLQDLLPIRGVLFLAR